MLANIIIALILLSIGYFWGKYIGEKEGFKEGFLLTPLWLRQESLDEGKCLLCNNEIEFSISRRKKLSQE